MSAEYAEYVEYYKTQRLENKGENEVDENPDGWDEAQQAVADAIAANNKTLFEIAPRFDLGGTYLSGFPVSTRNTYDCRCCLHFVAHAGRLVTIDPNTGDLRSLLRLANPPELLEPALNQVAALAEGGVIQGLYVHT